MEPIVSTRLRGDRNNYYGLAAPSEMEGVEMAFLGGQEEPEIIVQDAPTAGEVFTHDRITYKVRYEFGGAPVNDRAFQGGIVA